MSIEPRFLYFLSDSSAPVAEDSSIWEKPLPLTRDQLAEPENKPDTVSISHANYFLAARAFLQKNDCEHLGAAVGQYLQQGVKPQQIEQIGIVLEKHGAFYHPARVNVNVNGNDISFVLNVAVSETGREHIAEEYCTLKKLNRAYSASYLPRVYGCGDVYIHKNLTLSMFLGEWFNAYHEFHICPDNLERKNKIAVWDSSGENFFLSAGQALKLYEQMAAILTYYYNLESFEQIHSWHHAAGDFVVNVENENVNVKLISARRYAPMFGNADDLKTAENPGEMILQALLIFFLNLTVRMRLDRLTGAGDIVWAAEPAVAATLNGFLKALALKPAPAALPDVPARCFDYYISSCSRADLVDLLQALNKRLHPSTAEMTVIEHHLGEHVETLFRCLCRLQMDLRS